MITPARLAEIRAAVEKATPGPWTWEESQDPDDGDIGGFVANGEGVLHFGSALPYDNAPGSPPSEADIAFIALARSAVPELLSELDRLRAEAAEMWDRIHDERCSAQHAPTPPECLNPYRSGP